MKETSKTSKEKDLILSVKMDSVCGYSKKIHKGDVAVINVIGKKPK